MRESGAADEPIIFAACVENEYPPGLASWAGKFDQPSWKCSAGGGEVKYGCKSGLEGAGSISSPFLGGDERQFWCEDGILALVGGRGLPLELARR
jgi:hypothetical protein